MQLWGEFLAVPPWARHRSTRSRWGPGWAWPALLLCGSRRGHPRAVCAPKAAAAFSEEGLEAFLCAWAARSLQWCLGAVPWVLEHGEHSRSVLCPQTGMEHFGGMDGLKGLLPQWIHPREGCGKGLWSCQQWGQGVPMVGTSLLGRGAASPTPSLLWDRPSPASAFASRWHFVLQNVSEAFAGCTITWK